MSETVDFDYISKLAYISSINRKRSRLETDSNEQVLKKKLQAANQGDSRAQLECAFYYARTLRDFVQAHKYYECAAKAGLATAQHNLACMYLKGDGCTRDIDLARHWFEAAAKQGDVDAQFNLGLIYSEGRHLEQDDQLAFKWFQLAAESGSARAQYDLGQIYEHGRGVPKNLKLAAAWYDKAAEQGVDRARQKLARIRSI